MSSVQAALSGLFGRWGPRGWSAARGVGDTSGGQGTPPDCCLRCGCVRLCARCANRLQGCLRQRLWGAQPPRRPARGALRRHRLVFLGVGALSPLLVQPPALGIFPN